MLKQNQPALILAPMEGITDAPMRSFFGESGVFAFAVSEFIRVSALVPPPRVFLKHVPELKNSGRTLNGMPVVVQILGGDPERIAQTALVVAQLGTPAIDLNFGCPAKTVNRHDGGATLLKYPCRIRKIVETVRKYLPQDVFVSAKLRLGWDSMDEIHRNADEAAAGGASWITIHGRTREQAYRPPAYWGPIGQVRKRLQIPVIANGEIWTREDLIRCREETGCDHFMIGRGALANPLLPFELARELRIDPSISLPETDWLRWLKRFEALCTGYPNPCSLYVARRMKQWLRFAHQRQTINWFDQIKHCQSPREIIAAAHSLPKTSILPAACQSL